MSESMSIHDRTERDAGYVFILIFAIMAMGIVLIGYLYYLNYERNYRTALESDLSSIAKLKVGGLVEWRKERLGDGALLLKNRAFSALVRRFLENPGDTDAQSKLQDWIGKYLMAYQYVQVYLVDTQGRVRMSVPEAPGPHVSSVASNVAEILRSGKVDIEDFHRNTPGGPIHLVVRVPIFDESDGGRPLGVLALKIDPTTYLYPFISSWPWFSETSETLLVRKDGDDALFLSELRFHKNAALNLRIPLTKTEVPAVRAALGQTGVVEGVDYRGEPALAAIRPVPGSPWAMVARMNTSEVYAVVRERLWETLAFVGVLLFGSGAAMGFVWRQKSARYRERDKVAEAIHESEARFRQLAEATFEAVIITESGRILDVNKSFLEMFGYEKAEEVVGKKTLEFVAPEYHELAAGRIAAGYEEPYEVMVIRKDGSHFPIEVHGRTSEIAGRRIRITAARDMTERKKAEKALLESENKYRVLVEETSDWVWELNENGVFTYSSPQAREITGYGAEEILGKTPFDYMRPEEARRAVEFFRATVATRKPFKSFENSTLHKDGHEVVVETSGTPYFSAEGRFIGYRGINRDVTERKKAEVELKKTVADMELYRLMIEKSGDPVFLIDDDDGCRMIYVNEAAIKHYKAPLEEILTWRIPDWDPNFTYEKLPAHVEEIKNLKNLFIESLHRVKGGEIVPVEISLNIVNYKGHTCHFGYFKNITERKKAEMALAQSELNYRTVANFTNDWETWREPDGRFRYVSPSCERITGYPPERFIADPDFLPSIIHKQDIETYNKHIANSHTAIACSDGQDSELERLMFRITRKDGEVRWIEHVCQRVFDENGVFIGNRGSNRDITDLVAAREQAEAATRLKDQFVSLVAHDLRSPFTSMMGLLRHFVDSKPLLANEEDQKVLDAVFQSGDRMVTMIEDLLKISRLQTGNITPRPQFFKGHMAVTVTIGSISHAAAQKGIEIINGVPLDTRLYADQMLFDEVLLNLLSNSIKFCPKGGKITFFTPPGLKSAIAIRDTGKGIEEKIIPNLFKHEVKTTTPGTAGELGTGLGLPYCYDIIKAHGGEITVESAPGKGAVFCVMLPYVRPIALVVDDDPMSLLVVRSHLERIGIDVIEALSAERALDGIKDKRPHIVIADINMPEMDGFALLDRLKQDSATSGIPVIVMTSMNVEARDKAFRHGADDFVKKPIEAEDFIPRVRRFVG